MGTEGDDILNGTPGIDLIQGLGGNDEINGGPGNDCLEGGDGDDILDGKRGDDRVDGGPGNDRVVGGAGRDLLLGGEGDDILSDGLGKNTFRGGPGIDAIFARQSIAETIDCGPGRDLAVVDRKDTVRNCEQVSRPGQRSIKRPSRSRRLSAVSAGSSTVTERFRLTTNRYYTRSRLVEAMNEAEKMAAVCGGAFTGKAGLASLIRKWGRYRKVTAPGWATAMAGFIGGRSGSAISGATGAAGLRSKTSRSPEPLSEASSSTSGSSLAPGNARASAPRW